MSLTNSQFNTLRAGVIANATANAMRVAGDAFSLQAWLNRAANPAVLAWRIAVLPQEADEAASYATFDSIVAGKRDSWGFFLQFPRNFNRNKVRNWITDVWGSATAGSNAEAILQAGTENATNAQSIIGGSPKTTGTVSAIDRNFVDLVFMEEVNRLIAS